MERQPEEGQGEIREALGGLDVETCPERSRRISSLQRVERRKEDCRVEPVSS